MQLKQFAKITSTLACATGSLLGTEAAAEEDDWQFDTAILYYGESDGRVKATEGIFAAKRNFDYGEALDLKITIDALTGASPTGAVPQPTVQTFTRPSGRGAYRVTAGETPLDDTFKDTRVQLNGQWTQPWIKDYTISSGVHFSKEYDYTSLGFNTSIARDMYNKNTTFSAGFSFSRDNISPEGGRPIPLYSIATTGSEDYDEDNDEYDDGYNEAFAKTRLKGDGDKNVVDLLFGMTQVINRRMLMQFNYSLSKVDGYQTDPFKFLSVVDDAGLSQDHVYEHRPEDRTKHAFFWQTKYHFDVAIADVSYRYMRDDWEIHSHTVDSKLRFSFDNGLYIEPRMRYYRQDAAYFYRPFLNQTEALPEYASADYRVGAFDAITIGAKAGMALPSGDSLSVRLAYYTQKPDNSGYAIPGVLNNYDLNPDISAVILQLGYSF